MFGGAVGVEVSVSVAVGAAGTAVGANATLSGAEVLTPAEPTAVAVWMGKRKRSTRPQRTKVERKAATLIVAVTRQECCCLTSFKKLPN